MADPATRLNLDVDADLLGRLALTINLDERGLIHSVTSEAGFDVVPLPSPAGTTVSIAAPAPAQPADAKPWSLEEQWTETHKSLAWRALAIEQSAGRLLDSMGDPNASAETILQSGRALECLQAQLGNLGQVKRAWIAAQAQEISRGEWRFSANDLVRIADRKLSEFLPDVHVPEGMRRLAVEFGVVIAIADGDRRKQPAPVAVASEDTLAFRRSRPVQVGAYRPTQGGSWRLEAASVLAIDIVDDYSDIDHLSLDGPWLRTKAFNLAYHPDMSVKTLGLSTASSASAIASSLSGVASAAVSAASRVAELTAEAEQVGAEQAQRDLLTAAPDYEGFDAGGRGLPAQRTKITDTNT